jgi:hypothetical protein
MGADALGTAESETRRAKHEDGNQHPDTAENEFDSVKQENETKRPRYRRKRVRDRKT